MYEKFRNIKEWHSIGIHELRFTYSKINLKPKRTSIKWNELKIEFVLYKHDLWSPQAKIAGRKQMTRNNKHFVYEHVESEYYGRSLGKLD